MFTWLIFKLTDTDSRKKVPVRPPSTFSYGTRDALTPGYATPPAERPPPTFLTHQDAMDRFNVEFSLFLLSLP